MIAVVMLQTVHRKITTHQIIMAAIYPEIQLGYHRKSPIFRASRSASGNREADEDHVRPYGWVHRDNLTFFIRLRTAKTNNDNRAVPMISARQSIYTTKKALSLKATSTINAREPPD